MHVSNKRSLFCIHGKFERKLVGYISWPIGHHSQQLLMKMVREKHNGGLAQMRCRDGRWGWFGANLLEILFYCSNKEVK